MPCNSLSRPWEGGRCSQIVAETRQVRVSRNSAENAGALALGESWLVVIKFGSPVRSCVSAKFPSFGRSRPRRSGGQLALARSPQQHAVPPHNRAGHKHGRGCQSEQCQTAFVA
jgi:hypothetical protein